MGWDIGFDVGGFLGGIGGGVLGGIFQSKENEEARSWTEGMRATSHQVEVKDLEKAGLNPILSATGPMSVPAAANAPLGIDVDIANALQLSKTAQEIKESKAREGNYKELMATQKELTKREASDAVVSAIQAERAKRQFDKVDQSPIGKQVMPWIDRGKGGWFNQIVTGASGLSNYVKSFLSPNSAGAEYGQTQSIEKSKDDFKIDWNAVEKALGGTKAQ